MLIYAQFTIRLQEGVIVEVRQIVRFQGAHSLVLEDIAKLLEFLKGLSTAQLIDETDNAVTGPASEWPTYRHRLLRYNGHETTISQVHDKVFDPLWESRGQMVPFDVLEAEFSERVDPRQGVHEAISRLRAQLKIKMPEIEVVTAGDGYYLRLTS